MNTNWKIRLLIINWSNLKQACVPSSSVVFLSSLASSLAVLLSSLVIMTVFGLNCCPPASPTSAQLFIELHSSSIHLHLSLLLSPSSPFTSFFGTIAPISMALLCFFFWGGGGGGGFQLFCPIRSSHSIDQSLPLSVSTPPSNCLFDCLFILLLLPALY